MLLKNFPDHIRHNRDIVKAAILQNGLALQHASMPLRSEKNICFLAAEQNIDSTDFASDIMKKSYEFMSFVVQKDGMKL